MGERQTPAASVQQQHEPVIDLNRWHHALHQVTGAMALRFNKANAADLECWAAMLRTVAGEMEAQVLLQEGKNDRRL